MPKMTLLDIVQEILSDMNSDSVSSIGDTNEALQVANIVKRTFYNIINDRLWPTTGRLFSLTSSADAAKPTHMLIEDAVIHLNWVRYNKQLTAPDSLLYQEVQYMEPEEFLSYTMSRDSTKPNVETVFDYNGTPLFVLNDSHPAYYTSFDDKHLVFDSFDADVDSILQASKTQAFGEVEPEWLNEDSFVPDLPAKAFPYLLNESKSVAFLKVKEVFSQKDEQASNRQKAWLSREKHRVGGGTRYPDYGRKAASGGRYSRAGYRNNHFLG